MNFVTLDADPFDRIKRKIPSDSLPAGCRPEDQKIYEQLISKIDGVNLADVFPKECMPTCFPNELYFNQ